MHGPTQKLDKFRKFFKYHKSAGFGLFLIIIFLILAIFAPLISPVDPLALFTDFLKLPPAWAPSGNSIFLLGTDDVGRDLLSRLIYGARISLLIGVSIVTVSLLIGTFLGLISGFYGGKVDRVIMALIDIIMSFPSILLAIIVVSVLGPGLTNAIIAVSIVSIPGFTRIVRGSVMVEKKKDYVSAAISFGSPNYRIIFREILPNCMAPLIVQGSLGFSDGILNTAALGFLGMGAEPPLPEWGIMLSDARPYIESSPWMVTLPGLCILIVVLGFNLFGDGLRDALDPKLKK
jgi:ABC-type dipeptide/oligopeptide/nickel transport system permease subunit